MVKRGTVKLRELACSRAEEVGFSRWLNNGEVRVKALQAQLAEEMSRRVAGRRHVLAIQDTTEINYQKQAKRKRGLGPVGNGSDLGFFAHPLLVVDAENGDCLGLADLQLWHRTEGKAKNYQDLPIEQKESNRWLKGAALAKRALNRADQVTVIADRESDIYELLARAPSERCHLLVRMCQDRNLADGRRLRATLDALPVVLVYEITVPGDGHGRQPRQARLEVSFGEVTIRQPARGAEVKDPPTVTLSAVRVAEIVDPNTPVAEPINWYLLTTHPVLDAEAALQIIDWYRMRWHIEQLFRTVKHQGLDIEASQVEDRDSLFRLAILAFMTATIIMQLVLARDGNSAISRGIVFNPSEIIVLEQLNTKLEGKTAAQKNPYPPDRLAWATWVIARLGGWKGYRSEKKPGPITMSRGYRQFVAIYEGYSIALNLA